MIAQEVTDRFESNLTLQDRVRLFLDARGHREVDITIEQLAKNLDKPEASVYQVINILRQRNELDVVKEPQGTGPDKIVKLIINKLEPSGRTYKRAAERSGRINRIKPQLDSIVPAKDELFLPETVEYLKKKLALEDMKTRALAVGLDESVISFEPEPQAEEAINLLKAFTDLKHSYEELRDSHQMAMFDLEAEKRNVAALKNQLRKDTDDMLRGEYGKP